MTMVDTRNYDHYVLNIFIRYTKIKYVKLNCCNTTLKDITFILKSRKFFSFRFKTTFFMCYLDVYSKTNMCKLFSKV